MSDEEAQEVTRLLSPVDVKDGQWHPNASSSFLQDSTSGPNSLLLDSTGPQSLNDSLGPSSLQDDSHTESIGGSFNELLKTQGKEILKESATSLDASSYDDGFSSSKMESSVSDSGLIGILLMYFLCIKNYYFV